MFLTLAIPSETTWRWRIAPYWARITVHKRLILVLGICGALMGGLTYLVTPKVYAARVVIRAGDTFASGWDCSLAASTAPVTPLAVQLASELDAAACELGLPNPKLAERITKSLEAR